MSKPFDPKLDPLAGAALTPEQRASWDATRKALADARAQAEDLEEQIKKLEQHAPDDQPGILTRAEFNREVARMLAYDERYGGNSSILYLDVGNMEDTVTRYGKSVANAALREVSDALMKNVRSSDIVGRLAPNEFGVMLVRCDNANAWKKAKGLADTLAETLAEIHSCRLNVVINYGAYTFQSEEDVATGLKQAAQMLKRASVN